MAPNIRVEDRLLHGQVLLKWVGEYRARQILIINDETAKDPVMQSIYRASFSAREQIRFYSVRSFEEELMEEDSAGDRMADTLILVKNIETLSRIEPARLGCRTVTFSRLPYARGKKLLCSGFFVSDLDQRILQSLSRKKNPAAFADGPQRHGRGSE